MVIPNEQAFEQLFTDWFGGLHTYAFSMLKDDSEAEEVVQAVFCRIWERRASIPEPVSMKAYLYGCVYHACVDQLRQRKARRGRHTNIGERGESAAGRLELAELEGRFERVLAQLPEQCRNIYQLSRFGELRYREIADQLGISVKTVEAQMSKALKRLREQLMDYL
jgi:RNA polymerase sigma-70 factor (ECF subfamily)